MTVIESIKKLRQETGLSMALIKKAVEKEHDYESALAYLKQYRQEDKHDQVGKKGMVVIKSKGNIAILYEVNAMTDFVQTHPAFISFVEDLGHVLMGNPKASLDTVLSLEMGDTTVDDHRVRLETLIGEHVKISRFESVVKNDSQQFGLYQHFNHKSATVIILDGGDERHANTIAKQITAIGALYPKWKSTVIDQILASVLFGAEQTVRDYLTEAKATLVHTSRYELGEAMTEHLSCSLLSKDACHIA